jgi:hypothetical protein
VLKFMEAGRGRPSPEALRTPPRYNGLGIRIDFEPGTNVNRALFFHRYRDGAIELLN